MVALLDRHDARESWRVKRSLQGETAECREWGVRGGEWFLGGGDVGDVGVNGMSQLDVTL